MPWIVSFLLTVCLEGKLRPGASQVPGLCMLLANAPTVCPSARSALSWPRLSLEPSLG